MMFLILLALLVIIAFIGVGLWLELKGNISEKAPLPELLERQRREKEEGKWKILGLARRGEKLTNDQVQDLLRVSDATATRYLDELEKEGKLRQVGAEGRSVYYVKI